MSNVPGPGVGASCLPGFAAYLPTTVTQRRTIDAAATTNTQYVIVHLYLVPGDIMQRRELRNAIRTELGALNAIPLHDLAYAVPTVRSGERATAEDAWDRLLNAGALATGEAQYDGWLQGDVVYVHYLGIDGMSVLAAEVRRDGQRLPVAPEAP